MKRHFALLSLSSLLSLAASACATAPPPISAAGAHRFHDTVAQAKRAGADDGYSPAAHKLRDAEADFYYAEHLPSDPEKARRMAQQAQQEADEALLLARS